MSRNGWLAIAMCLAGGAIGLYLWGGKVHGPARPAAAALPASVRKLLTPFRRDSVNLTVRAHEELKFRVGMEAGDTLVYAWSTRAALFSESPGQKEIRAAEAHGAFEARSSGWYRWNWKNETGDSIAVHLKLSGYYELAGMPYDR